MKFFETSIIFHDRIKVGAGWFQQANQHMRAILSQILDLVKAPEHHSNKLSMLVMMIRVDDDDVCGDVMMMRVGDYDDDNVSEMK